MNQLVNKTKQINCNSSRGGILLLVMIVMIVFIAMAFYILQFIIRQSHEITNQKREEEIFAVAESGVSHAIWLLSSSGEDYSPEEIETLDTITDHPVEDDTGRVIGEFTLTDISADDETHTIEFKSVGKNINSDSNRCQSIRAQLYQRQEEVPYRVTKWDHQVDIQCP